MAPKLMVDKVPLFLLVGVEGFLVLPSVAVVFDVGMIVVGIVVVTVGVAEAFTRDAQNILSAIIN